MMDSFELLLSLVSIPTLVCGLELPGKRFTPTRRMSFLLFALGVLASVVCLIYWMKNVGPANASTDGRKPALQCLGRARRTQVGGSGWRLWGEGWRQSGIWAEMFGRNSSD